LAELKVFQKPMKSNTIDSLAVNQSLASSDMTNHEINNSDHYLTGIHILFKMLRHQCR
jgi:hypothetical protein